MPDRLRKLAFRAYRRYETSLHDLNYLFWECTTRCNLNCLHCGSDCKSSPEYPDMPAGDFLSALDTIENPGEDFIVVITGGEPLLRDDLEQVGREIRKRGMRWGIVTNGYLYTPERHNFLLNAGMGAITISLDGLENSHNWLRNDPQSFSKAVEAISLAAGSSRLSFDVVTCASSRNIGELPHIRDLLLDLGVRSWRIFTIAPSGRAKGNRDLLPGQELLKRLMDFISTERKSGKMDIRFSCEGYTGGYELKVRDSYFFCRAGINIGSILADGSISACPNIDREFSQGNIYSDSFQRVWRERFYRFRHREWTRTGRCASCREFTDCLGNGMHYRREKSAGPLICHNALIGSE